MTEEQVRFKVNADSELPVVIGQLDKLIQAQTDLGNQGDKLSKQQQSAWKAQGSAIRDVAGEIKETQSATEKAINTQAEYGKKQTKEFDGLGSTIKSVRNQFIAAFGVAEIKEFISTIFELTATWQKYTAALTVSLGSEKKAAEALGMLQTYADKTNFSLDELADTFSKFAGRNLVLGRQSMEKMGDVANALQKPFKDLGEAILDVNNTERWTELGIKAQTNGNKVALTFKGVTLEVERTEQGVLRAIEVFGTMNGVAGQTAKQSETLAGLWSTLKDGASGLGRALGQEATPAFEGAIRTGIELTTVIQTQSQKGGILHALYQSMKSTVKDLGDRWNEFIQPMKEIAIRWFPELFGATSNTNNIMRILATAVNLLVVGPFKALILVSREIHQAMQAVYNGVQGVALGFYGVQKALTGDLAGMGQAFALSKEYFDKAGKNFAAMKDIYLKTTEDFVKNQKNIWQSGDVTLKKIDDITENLTNAQKKAVALENAKWEAISKTLKQGTDAYYQAELNHLVALDKAKGTFIKAAGEKEKDNAKKSAAEIQKIELEGMEKTFEVRGKIIENEAKLEIERLNALYKKKKISEEDFSAKVLEINTKKIADLKKLDDERAAQEKHSAAEIQRINLAAMEKTYEVRRKIVENGATIEIESINKMLDKEKISREKAAEQIKAVEQKKVADLLAIKNEEDAKIEALTKKLQDSVADINQKAGKEVIKINAETVKKIVDGKMELGDYEKIIANERLKIEKDLAERVEKIHEDTAKIIKATREGEIKFAQEALEKFVGQHSEIGGAAVKAWHDYKNSVTATAEATAAVNVAQLNLNELIYSGTASVVDIANAEKNLAKAREEQSKAGINAAQTNLNLASSIANVAEAIKNSLVEELIKKYELMGQTVARMREVLIDFYNTAIESNQQALSLELENFTGTWEEKERIMTAYFAREKELMESRDRADAEMAFQQSVLAITSDTTTKIASAWDISKGPLGPKALFNVLMSFKEHNAQLNAAAYEREAYEEQLRQQRIQQEVDAAGQIRDAKISAIKEEMDAFRSAKEEEIRLENEALDARMQKTEQFYSDKEMRLVNDDVYRQSLLDAGEAREIAALEAAKNREIDRATQSGATAEEIARIREAFDKSIAEVHTKYQDVILDKDEAVKLATVEAKAQETDEKNKLEEASAVTINKYKDQIAAKDQQTKLAMTYENERYRDFVLQANKDMLESQKAMAIAQIKAEIAILKGKRNIFNSGRINAAIGDMENAIRELEGIGSGPVALGDTVANRIQQEFINRNKAAKTPFNADNMQPVNEAFNEEGTKIELTYTDDDRSFFAKDASGNTIKIRNAFGLARRTITNPDGTTSEEVKNYFHGTPYIDGIGYPQGIDTVPAWLNKGERIVPTSLNEKLGPKVSNEDLVKSYLKFDELKAKFGDIRIPEFGMLNYGVGDSLGKKMDLAGVVSKLENLIELTEKINSKPGYQINVDANHITVGEIGRNEQHVTYYEDIYNR